MGTLLIGIEDVTDIGPEQTVSVPYTKLIDMLGALKDEIEFVSIQRPVLQKDKIVRGLESGANAIKTMVNLGVLDPPPRTSSPAQSETVEDGWIFPGSTTAPSFSIG